MSKKVQQKHLVEAKGPADDMAPRDMLKTRRFRYLLINVVSRRARDLTKGDRALTDLPLPHSPTELALAEVEEDLVKAVRKQKSKVMVSMIKND